MGLTGEQIQELLVKERTRTFGYPPPPQKGPLRYVDQTLRCVSRGCNSATWCKVNGIPKCPAHALIELNEMVVNIRGY